MIPPRTKNEHPTMIPFYLSREGSANTPAPMAAYIRTN